MCSLLQFYQTLDATEVTEQFLWGRLEPLLGYLSQPALFKVREALSLAFDSHHGQLRKSGEPYITHPVEVTRILAELQMDHDSLIAGLLHDTVEDTQAVTFEEIGQVLPARAPCQCRFLPCGMSQVKVLRARPPLCCILNMEQHLAPSAAQFSDNGQDWGRC